MTLFNHKVCQLVSLFVMFTIVPTAYSASNTDDHKIIVEKRGLGVLYKYDGKILSRQSVKDIIIKDSRAKEEIEKGDRYYYPALISAGVGGGLIGFTVGKAIFGSGTNWTVGLVGIGIAATGIYLASRTDAHYEKAVMLFNNKQKTSAFGGFDVAVSSEAGVLSMSWNY